MSELQGEKRKADEELPEEAQRAAPHLAALGISVVRICGLEVNDEVEEFPCIPWERYFDERTGLELDAAAVKAAREEELEFMKKIELFEESTLEECYEMTGKAPVSTKWVDVNKNTEQLPDIRCRLVGRDFKPRGEKDREDLFAAMPPLECKKILF